MALIQYDLQKDASGKYSVSCSVMEVDKGDRIQFTSNVPGAGIEYQKAWPFEALKPGDPLAKAISVPDGKKVTGPFTVTEKLTDANRVDFTCGALPPGEVGVVKSWGTGAGIPPGSNNR
jgi:hypothetical protein